MKMKKGLCPCSQETPKRHGRLPVHGDAAVDRGDFSSRNGGGSPQWLQEHVLRCCQRCGIGLSRPRSRAGSAMAEKTAQATGGRFDHILVPNRARRPPSSAFWPRVRLHGSDEQ